MASDARGSSRIKKLAKAMPDEQDVYNTLHALEKENSPFADYAIAIIGAGYLERILAVSMKWRFVDLTPEEEKRLFNYEFNGPIADFSARIKIGYAMYLFGRETRDDLEKIRTIRNLFAHHHEIITFNTDEIKDACGELLIIKRKHTSALRGSKGARGFYITACREISHSIQMAVMTRTTKWNPSREGPKPPRGVP